MTEEIIWQVLLIALATFLIMIGLGMAGVSVGFLALFFSFLGGINPVPRVPLVLAQSGLRGKSTGTPASNAQARGSRLGEEEAPTLL